MSYLSLPNLVEAIVLSADEPVPLPRVLSVIQSDQDYLDTTANQVHEALATLAQRYESLVTTQQDQAEPIQIEVNALFNDV